MAGKSDGPPADDSADDGGKTDSAPMDDAPMDGAPTDAPMAGKSDGPPADDSADDGGKTDSAPMDGAPMDGAPTDAPMGGAPMGGAPTEACSDGRCNLFYTSDCQFCGIDWCEGDKVDLSSLSSEYTKAPQTLQERGCDGVDGSWSRVIDRDTDKVYAVQATLTPTDD